MSKFSSSIIAGAMCLGLYSFSADATIVTLETSVGNIDINLYDETTPQTVANFLAYVNDGRYDNTFIHRSVPGFVIQGGGFVYSSDFNFEAVDAYSAVANEPKLSNVRGTVAMAKLGGQPDSATSQFFFNLDDNSANLDNQNGGFTVFGEITAESLARVDEVATYTLGNFGSAAFTDVPLKDFTQDDIDQGNTVTEENFVIIYSATISDAATDTAAGLNPPANPNWNNNPDPTNPTNPDSGSSSGGGGSLGVFAAMLGLIGFRRRLR